MIRGFQSFSHLEEHRADERHFPVDWSAAEDVSSSERQRNVLDHLSQELEVLDVAHEVQRVVDSAQRNENVLKDRQLSNLPTNSHQLTMRLLSAEFGR
jgi:hypothetical protein